MADPRAPRASSQADRTEVVPPADRTEVVAHAPADRTEIVAHAPLVPPADRTEILSQRPAPADRTEILRPAGHGPTLLTDRAPPPAETQHTERVFAPPSPDTTLIVGDPQPSPPPVAAPPRPAAPPPVSINRALIWINVLCFAAILLLVLLLGLLS